MLLLGINVCFLLSGMHSMVIIWYRYMICCCYFLYPFYMRYFGLHIIQQSHTDIWRALLSSDTLDSITHLMPSSLKTMCVCVCVFLKLFIWRYSFLWHYRLYVFTDSKDSSRCQGQVSHFIVHKVTQTGRLSYRWHQRAERSYRPGFIGIIHLMACEELKRMQGVSANIPFQKIYLFNLSDYFFFGFFWDRLIDYSSLAQSLPSLVYSSIKKNKGKLKTHTRYLFWFFLLNIP